MLGFGFKDSAIYCLLGLYMGFVDISLIYFSQQQIKFKWMLGDTK